MAQAGYRASISLSPFPVAVHLPVPAPSQFVAQFRERVRPPLHGVRRLLPPGQQHSRYPGAAVALG